MKLMKISLVLTLFLLPSIVFAYPRFGALAGEKCSSCHFQASGGGIRTERGNLFAAENLMMKTFQTEDYEFDPQIKEGIRLGGDLRTMNYFDTYNNSSNHIQMEGVLYGFYSLTKSVDINLGIGFNALSEVYGRFKFSKEAYIKAGLFVPDYGIKIPDHRSPIRKIYKFDNFGYYVGLEAGYSSENFDISSYFGNKDGGTGQYSDKGKMGVITGRFVQQFGESSFMLGFSGRSAVQAPTNTSLVQNEVSYASFFSLGLMQRVSILGQFDIVKDTYNIGAEVKGKIAMAEVSYVIAEGLHFRYQFDFLDINDDVDDSNYIRHVIGIPIFFATGFELEPMVQMATIGKNFVDPTFYQYISNKPMYLLMTHFYF